MVLKQRNSLCILCFKLASSSSSFELSSKKTRDWDVSTSEQFILLLSRHLNLSSKETPNSHVKVELLFCEVCSKLAKSFLQLYFQLECIRLEVEWNVRKMYETMLCAGRVSSRFNAFKTQFELTSKPSGDEEEDEETKRIQEVFTDLVKLRKNIIRKAKQQRKSSLPKVKLKRLSEPDKVIKTEAKSSPIKTHPLKKLELVTALLTSIVVVHLSLPLHHSNIPNSFQESSSCVPPESDLLFMEEDLEEDAPSPTSAQYDEAPLSNHSCRDDDNDNQMSVAVEYLVESNESYETNLETENYVVQMELDESNFTTNVDVINDGKDDKSEAMTPSTISSQKDSMGGESEEVCNIVQKLDKPKPSRNNVIELGPENLVKMETDEASNKDNQDDDRNDIDLEQVPITSIEKEPEEDFQRKPLRTLLKCSKCPKTFANQKSLNAHGRAHREKVPLESESDSSSSDEDEEISGGSEDEDKDLSENHSDLEMEMNVSEDDEKLETELEAKQKKTKIAKKIISKTRTKVKASSTAKVKRIPSKIPPNECEICHETFSCEGAVEKHRVIHHKLEEYARCHPCGKLFGSHAYLQRHQIGSPCLGKGPQRDFLLQFPTFGGLREGNKFCPFEECYEVFHSEEYVDIHIKAHGDFKCLQCPQEFTKAHEFAWHEVTHHNDKDKNCPVKFSYARKDPTKMKFRCSRCNYGFGRRTSLLTHFIYKHLGISNVRTSGKVKNQCEICKYIFAPYACKKTINQHKKLHNVEGLDPSAVATCGICKAPFINIGLLTQHLRNTHNKVKLDCPHCGKNHFGNRHLLTKHIQSKHPGRTTGAPGEFECKICKERFDRKYNFGVHMKAHEVNDKPEFKCEKCGAVFRKHIRLKVHYSNIHKAPKEILPCETCGKVFKDAVKLKQHTSYTHTDPSEWKFPCEEKGCGKRCWSRQKLREHMRTHTKERPFVCDFCGEAYRYRQYLRTHLAKVHGETAANTLPTQLYTKPFDEVMRKQHETIEKEGSSDSSDSAT
ncbi:unnamed protein product [Orchesella dallaii]|uniref:C2H2-type domain-containing protein n=1 Tax=Orchesella dallaii TaxID=48710 RepID=A0ABP1S5H2_9HEXA